MGPCQLQLFADYSDKQFPNSELIFLDRSVAFHSTDCHHLLEQNRGHLNKLYLLWTGKVKAWGFRAGKELRRHLVEPFPFTEEKTKAEIVEQFAHSHSELVAQLRGEPRLLMSTGEHRPPPAVAGDAAGQMSCPRVHAPLGLPRWQQ